MPNPGDGPLPGQEPPSVPGDVCPDGAAPQPYEVAPGDTLWGIAERSLLGSGTVAEIDAGWRALYARSADVIGGDPDRILPGQRLLACR